jgi:hypothetical protein
MEQVEKMMNFDLSATSKSWCSVGPSMFFHVTTTPVLMTPTWNVTTTPVLGPFPSKFRSESSETTSQTLYLHSWSSPGLGCGVQPC